MNIIKEHAGKQVNFAETPKAALVVIARHLKEPSNFYTFRSLCKDTKNATDFILNNKIFHLFNVAKSQVLFNKERLVARKLAPVFDPMKYSELFSGCVKLLEEHWEGYIDSTESISKGNEESLVSFIERASNLGNLDIITSFASLARKHSNSITTSKGKSVQLTEDQQAILHGFVDMHFMGESILDAHKYFTKAMIKYSKPNPN